MQNPTAPSGFKVLTGGNVSNRGEQALLKQSTILMFAVAIAGIVTGVISGAQSILFDGFFSLIATAIKVLMLISCEFSSVRLRFSVHSLTVHSSQRRIVVEINRV